MADEQKEDGEVGRTENHWSLDSEEPAAKRPYLLPDVTMISSDEGELEDIDMDGETDVEVGTGRKNCPVNTSIRNAVTTNRIVMDSLEAITSTEVSGDDEETECDMKSVACPQPQSSSSGDSSAVQGERGTVELDPDIRVTRTGHFIRQEVMYNTQCDPWREETEAHAEIGPVKYVQEQAVAPGRDEYELPLPDGWLEIQHRSGLPVYMHRSTRVCTWSRPYYLGPHSARRHDLPLAAIPCLMQKFVTKDSMKGMVHIPQPIPASKECPMQPAQNAQSNEEKELNVADDDNITVVPTVEPEKLLKYARSLWEVKTVETHCFCRHCRMKLKSEAGETEEDLDQLQPPQAANDLAQGELQNDGSMFFRIGKKGGTILHTAGKTPLSVLNEYCQRILRQRPEFLASETEDAKNPFRVAVVLNGIQYGVGFGNSKKQARQGAAETTLQVINPLLAQQIQLTKTRQAQDIEDAFEDMPIDDPGIPQLCVELGMPRPSQVLAECLRRNQGTQPMTCDLKVEVLPNKMSYFKMKCGEHVVEGRCANKKIGRQTASQAMLKILHPHVFKWAAIMRIYCDPNSSTISQHPFEEDTSELVELQSRSKKGEPNTEILNELKRRMQKLLPPKDSGRPLDPNKVRLLHDYKVAHAGHASLAPVPPTHPQSRHSASSSQSSSRSSTQSSKGQHSNHSSPSSHSSHHSSRSSHTPYSSKSSQAHSHSHRSPSRSGQSRSGQLSYSRSSRNGPSTR